MNLDAPTANTTSAPWTSPKEYFSALDQATRHLDPPFATLHVGALAYNTHDMLRRAAGKPIRVASKSVRVRSLIDAVLAVPGYSGVLAYTLPEALWLAESTPRRVGITDVVVGYPTADRAAISRLAASPELAERVTLMVDSAAQLDLIDAVARPTERESLRICIELDASWKAPILGHLGVLRSPVFTPAQARSLAELVVSRQGFELVGMMAYEAQIAGVGDQPRRQPVQARLNKWMQGRSVSELRARRHAAVAAVRELTPLEFVNGGGTGSLESTAKDDSVTEIAAGSGLLAGHLFDNYSHFRPAPAAAFALSVVRKPSSRSATILGGGWIASGPPSTDRLPILEWPDGLRLAPREMAGEVQTPVTGRQAARLQSGDRVWMRHTKSGELSEHVNEFQVVDGEKVVGTVTTYRGEGKAFL